MTDLTDVSENELLDHLLGTSSMTLPTNVYVSLHTGDPGESGGASEVSGAGYARQICTFGVAAGGIASNNIDIDWTASGGDFGTITHVGLYYVLSGGTQRAKHTLSTSGEVLNGGRVVFAIGDLNFTLD